MPVTWQLTECDRETIARDLDGLLPDRIYDAHAHLYRAEWWSDPPAHVTAGPPDITLEVYREQMGWLFGGREVHGLHFAFPFPAAPEVSLAPANEWVAREVRKDRAARGQFLVRPTDDPEWVREEVRRLGLRGLKPFIFYADVPDIYQANLPDVLPEPLAQVASEEGWTVTFHLVRSRGVADPSNRHWIRHYCETYPGMQLILDHCARGFNPYHVLEGLPSLAGLDNLWIDASSVCNALAVQAALAVVGPGRMLYGSDFFVSHMRGTNFACGDTFIWVDEETALAQPGYSPGAGLPLVGVENLRAIKAALWAARLTEAQVEAFFWSNAAGLLAVE